MSMRWLTILQFLEIFAAYGIVTLFLPWRILGKRFHRFSVAEQLIAYFFAGNFYIIYLVYLLQFLRISSRVTLLLGTAGPFLFIWIWKRKNRSREQWRACWCGSNDCLMESGAKRHLWRSFGEPFTSGVFGENESNGCMRCRK